MSDDFTGWRPHVSHWGAFEAQSDGTRLTAIRPLPEDPNPSALITNVVGAQHDDARIDRAYVREGWLQKGPGAPCRGADRYLPISVDRAAELVADELHRVYATTGPQSVFGGSYGWSSAGRFHHGQSQIHRFLNCLGGYVFSVNNYSYGASGVLLPHVIGTAGTVTDGASSWQSIADHTELFVAFGGIPLKNMSVTPGGLRQHRFPDWLAQCRTNGTEFIHVSPLRDDAPEVAESSWIPARPGTDAALMLGIAYVIATEGLADRQFLARYCVGYAEFEKYLLGGSDGTPKTPSWAAHITGVPADTVIGLARRMARSRTMIAVSWSLQRAQHGEQPVWMAITLAAMLGQIGLPGGGFGHGYGSMGYVGTPRPPIRMPSLPQGRNPVTEYIPVARIADMLLNPGDTFHYDGHDLTYPDIRLVYWCGGNPFHHHQDLARLARAFNRPETVIVHEAFWTATAQHADLVLPASLSIERNDLAQGRNEATVTAMPRLTIPVGEARSDYELFSRLAERLGVADAFTEGRDEEGWLRHLYDGLRERVAEGAPDFVVPPFEEFWEAGVLRLPEGDPQQTLLADFRSGPEEHPLPTPSGKIEIWSATIDSFDYADCPGHPAWIEPDEWSDAPLAARFPLLLIANQPRTRLHSQLAVGDHSKSARVVGREPIRMNPADASARGLSDGDLVEVSSPRGRCLAGLVLSSDVREGVVQLSTGAWFEPHVDDAAFCQNGNPNVLTADRPTSQLSQGCAGQHSLVEVRAAEIDTPR